MTENNNEHLLFSQDNNEKDNAKDIIGDYLIKEKIGEGTFSKVKLGLNMFTGQKVAIKILDKMKLIEEEGIERVVRELKILSELNHPNIIKIYKIIEDEKYYYVVMEYCEEGELFNYIVEKNNLTDSESAFFYYQLINAIEYLHLNGIAHRDLKPENILLGENNLIKIIDFGLSNFFDENKLLSTPCGSPCYASPEMIRGENYNGADNDIWETGIILYAMLCGYLPFENNPNAKDNRVLFKKILSLNLDYPNFLTDSSVDLLKRILVADPKERIKIEEIKKHSFYLKGKKVFEQKQEYITFNELKLYNNQYNNYNNDLIATTKDKKEKFKNEYSKGYKNLLELKKYFDTKEQIATPIKTKVKLSSTTQKIKKINNRMINPNNFISTESNNIRSNIDGSVPLSYNSGLFKLFNKKNLKQNFLSQNNTFGNDNSKNIENKREKQIGIIKNITNILPNRDSNQYNIKINHYKKKEKSMDSRNNPQNLFFLNNILSSRKKQNEPNILKDSNRKFLSPVKINNNLYKNKRKQVCETDIYRNDYSNNNIRMNDKLIINLTNDGEKNISLLKIRHKIQSREKDGLNNKFFTPNTRVKVNNNNKFPIINSPRNTPPKYEKLKYNKNYKNDKRYFIRNLNFNNINNSKNKEKDYLHHLYNLKMKNNSPKL